MNKKLIQHQYKKNIDLLSEYDRLYYDISSPKVSDDKYDNLKKSILELEKKYKFLKSPKTPSQTVGYKPSKNFLKSLHRIPMLSLSNAFTEEDLVNFEKNYKFSQKKRISRYYIVLSQKLMEFQHH